MKAQESAPETKDGSAHIELDPSHEYPIGRNCNRLIGHAFRVMPVFMVVVIGFAAIDARYSFDTKLVNPPKLFFYVGDILDVFAAALVVLIAIETFTNVSLCLTADVIHGKLVVAMALMAAARDIFRGLRLRCPSSHMARVSVFGK